MEITYIPRNKIIKNKQNGFGIKKIEELAQDIKMGGLEQPLVVYASGDAYKLLTGERRLTAIDLLIASGEWTSDIPVVIKKLQEYNLPLPQDLKESYAILRTNMFTRGNLDDDDKLFVATEYSKIITELRRQGYDELIISENADGEKITENITGRIRDVVHNLTGISNGQLSKIEKINSKGTDNLKQAIHDKRININNADKLTSLPADKQDEILKSNDKITPEIVSLSLKKEQLSAYGTKIRQYPEGSLIKTSGCEGNHDCFACHLQCELRQTFCYCVEAPMGNPFSCTVLDIIGSLKTELGDKCQFVNLELAERRAGDNEPVPCCKKCKNLCGYACQKAVLASKKAIGEEFTDTMKKASVEANLELENRKEEEYTLSFFVSKYFEDRKTEKEKFIAICNKYEKNSDRAKKIQEYIAPYGCSGEHNSTGSYMFRGYSKGIDFEVNKQKAHMSYIEFVKALEELYGPWTQLPVFKNNEQRKNWLKEYKKWGLWYTDKNIDVNYYKFDFEDGSRLIAVEYPQRESDWSNDQKDVVRFHLLEKNKTKYGSKKTYDQKFCHTTNSTTELVEYLKNIQK